MKRCRTKTEFTESVLNQILLKLKFQNSWFSLKQRLKFDKSTARCFLVPISLHTPDEESLDQRFNFLPEMSPFNSVRFYDINKLDLRLQQRQGRKVKQGRKAKLCNRPRTEKERMLMLNGVCVKRVFSALKNSPRAKCLRSVSVYVRVPLRLDYRSTFSHSFAHFLEILHCEIHNLRGGMSENHKRNIYVRSESFYGRKQIES